MFFASYCEGGYCNVGPILTFDNIPVEFYADRFTHAFYERSTKRQEAPKDTFSQKRAARMCWIKDVLDDEKTAEKIRNGPDWIG